MDYVVVLTPDTNGTLEVSVPDLPWVHTFGETEADALAHAEDAILTALAHLIKTRQRIPFPKARKKGPTAHLSGIVSAKVALYNAMLDEEVTAAELARRLKVHRPQVDRLLDLDHASKLEALEDALVVLQRRLDVTVVAAAASN